MTKTAFKAFMIWWLFPYLCFVIFEAVFVFLVRSPHTTSAVVNSFYWNTELKIIFACAIEALIGTAILWLLPITRRWLGILIGVVASLALTCGTVMVEMKLFGG